LFAYWRNNTHAECKVNANKKLVKKYINPLNAELIPICHLLALLGAHHILHISRMRVKNTKEKIMMVFSSVHFLFSNAHA